MSRVAVYIVAFIAAVGALVALRVMMPPPTPIAPALPARVAAATQPATAPAPPATKPAPPITELLDVVRREQPNYSTTQPLDLPADLPDAARIELSSPVYLDGVGNLWITDPRGASLADVLKKPITSHTIIVKDPVLFVAWPPDGGTPDVFFRNDNGKIDSLTRGADDEHPHALQFPLAAEHDWSRAAHFAHITVVPGQASIMWLRSGEFMFMLDSFIPLTPGRTDVVLTESADTLYAWQPWENGRDGGDFAISIDAAGKHTRLDVASGWADRIIQLVPLADGSVLIVSRGDNGVELKLKSAADPQPLTADQLTATRTLAHQLADRDPVVREQAQRQLESLGPLIYPELEKLRETLPPEAQIRIETLLGQRFAPTLAGLRPLEGEVKTLARFRDGGCVLQLTGGGTTTDTGPNGEADQTIIPAYIAIRPGRFIQRLDLAAVANFDPQKYHLAAYADEWVISDPVAGPQRWIGQRLFPLVDPPMADYDDFVGVDAQHRWLFRSSKRPGKTLIIDPALPDITPRLPTWTIDAPDGCGWTNLGWPAVKRGQKIFVLGESGWRLPGDGEVWGTIAPATQPATGPSETWTVSGNTLRSPAGDRIILPAVAAAVFQAGDLVLVVGHDNTVTRFRLTPDRTLADTKPEATFTAGLPHDTPRRTWLDPAGRLVFAGDQLTVTFPQGRVPKAIGDLMLRTTR